MTDVLVITYEENTGYGEPYPKHIWSVCANSIAAAIAMKECKEASDAHEAIDVGFWLLKE